MNLDQQLRSDLRDAVEQVPTRHGSRDVVVSAGARRRTVALLGQFTAAVLVVVAVGAGSVALLGQPGTDRTAAGSDDVSTISVGGFEVAVDGLVPGFEAQEIYRAGSSPTPAFPTDGFGSEQPFDIAAPLTVDVEAVSGPSIYLGDFPLIGRSGFLYTDADGLACLRLDNEWCIDTTHEQAGALQWTIEPASSNPADGATMVVAWYGLPPQTSLVTAMIDGAPVGWQRVTGGAAALSVPIDMGSDLVLTAYDASGTMIDFGPDDTGELIIGEQRFDNLTFEGIGQ